MSVRAFTFRDIITVAVDGVYGGTGSYNVILRKLRIEIYWRRANQRIHNGPDAREIFFLRARDRLQSRRDVGSDVPSPPIVPDLIRIPAVFDFRR